MDRGARGLQSTGSQKSWTRLKRLSMHARTELRLHMPSGTAKRSTAITTTIINLKNHRHISVITDRFCGGCCGKGKPNKYTVYIMCVHGMSRRAEAFKSSGQDGLMTWHLTNHQPASGEVEALVGNEGRPRPGGKTSASQGPELGSSVWGRGGWEEGVRAPGGRVRSGRQAAILRLRRFPELAWRVSGLSRGRQPAPVTRRSSRVSYWERILQGQGGSHGKKLAAPRCPAGVMVAGTVCWVRRLGSWALGRPSRQDSLWEAETSQITGSEA